MANPRLNTYAAMTEQVQGGVNNDLKDYDTGLSADVIVAGVLGNPGTAPTATTYCLSSTHGGFTYHFSGPGGSVVTGVCP